jgi:hypothetical protein
MSLDCAIRFFLDELRLTNFCTNVITISGYHSWQLKKAKIVFKMHFGYERTVIFPSLCILHATYDVPEPACQFSNPTKY